MFTFTISSGFWCGFWTAIGIVAGINVLAVFIIWLMVTCSKDEGRVKE